MRALIVYVSLLLASGVSVSRSAGKFLKLGFFRTFRTFAFSLQAGHERPSCPFEGSVLNEQQTKCYIIRQIGFSFKETLNYCRSSFNGTLPMLTSKADEQIVVEASEYLLFFWLGVRGRFQLDSAGNLSLLNNEWIDLVARGNISKWDNDLSEVEPGKLACAEASLDFNDHGDSSVFWSARDCDNVAIKTVCEAPSVFSSAGEDQPTHEMDFFDSPPLNPAFNASESVLLESTTIESISMEIEIGDISTFSSLAPFTTEASLSELSENATSFFNHNKATELGLVLFNYIYTYGYLLHWVGIALIGVVVIALICATIGFLRDRRTQSETISHCHQEDEFEEENLCPNSSGMSILFIGHDKVIDMEKIPKNAFVIRV